MPRSTQISIDKKKCFDLRNPKDTNTHKRRVPGKQGTITKPDNKNIDMNAVCSEAASSLEEFKCVYTSVCINDVGGCELSLQDVRAIHMRVDYLIVAPDLL